MARKGEGMSYVEKIDDKNPDDDVSFQSFSRPSIDEDEYFINKFPLIGDPVRICGCGWLTSRSTSTNADSDFDDKC